MSGPLVSKSLIGAIFFLGLLGILLYSIIAHPALLLSIGMLAALIVVAVFLYSPMVGFLLILFLRPATDALSDSIAFPITDNFSVGATQLFGVLVIGFSILFLIRHKVRIFNIPLFFPWFFFLFALLASSTYSIDPAASLYECIRVLSITSIFLLGYEIFRRSRHKYELFAKVIMASSALPILVGLYQLVTGSGLGGTSDIDSRVFATFAHPNAFASYLLIVFAIVFYFFWKQKRGGGRQILYGLLALGIVLLLVLTFSRGAWLALVIFAGLFSLIKSPRLLFGMALFFILLFFTSQTVHNRIEDIYNPPADSSIVWRLQQWQRVYDIFTTAPLFGKGAGTEIIVHEQEYGFYAGNPYTHNDVLKIALENGIIGTTLYSILIVLVIIRLAVSAQQTKTSHPQQSLFLLCILLLFVAELGFSMSSNIWRGTAVMWTLWALVGASLALDTSIVKKLRKNETAA